MAEQATTEEKKEDSGKLKASKELFDKRKNGMDLPEKADFKEGDKFGYLCDDGVLIECEVIIPHSKGGKVFVSLGEHHAHLTENHSIWIDLPNTRICSLEKMSQVQMTFKRIKSTESEEQKKDESVGLKKVPVITTQDYVFKSIDNDNQKLICLDADFNDIAFDLPTDNKELMDKINKVCQDGTDQKKDVTITISKSKIDDKVTVAVQASIKKANRSRVRFEPIKKNYKIYDLTCQQDRKEFSNAIIQDTFALIKIPDKHKQSLHCLFDIYNKLFKSNKSLQCTQQQQYVGYTSTNHLKQSVWMYLDNKNKILFPQIKNNKSILYQNDNQKTVYNAYNNYNSIATDAMHAILQYQCKDKQSYIQCWNNLFPKNKIKIENKCDEKSNDIDIDMSDNINNYSESAVYHKYRKVYDLSLNNFACIQYFGNKNKKTKKSLLEKIKTKNENEVNQIKFPCEEHMDYTLITLIMANEPGIQVRDIMNFEWIDIEDIIKQNGVNRKDVLVVLSGLTLGTLMYDRVACYHSVKNSFGANDRMSNVLFCYADPNGIMDTSLIKPNFDFKITLRDQRKLKCSDYIAKNMHPSVNF